MAKIKDVPTDYTIEADILTADDSSEPDTLSSRIVIEADDSDGKPKLFFTLLVSPGLILTKVRHSLRLKAMTGKWTSRFISLEKIPLKFR